MMSNDILLLYIIIIVLNYDYRWHMDGEQDKSQDMIDITQLNWATSMTLQTVDEIEYVNGTKRCENL